MGHLGHIKAVCCQSLDWKTTKLQEDTFVNKKLEKKTLHASGNILLFACIYQCDAKIGRQDNES